MCLTVVTDEQQLIRRWSGLFSRNAVDAKEKFLNCQIVLPLAERACLWFKYETSAALRGRDGRHLPPAPAPRGSEIYLEQGWAWVVFCRVTAVWLAVPWMFRRRRQVCEQKGSSTNVGRKHVNVPPRHKSSVRHCMKPRSNFRFDALDPCGPTPAVLLIKLGTHACDLRNNARKLTSNPRRRNGRQTSTRNRYFGLPTIAVVYSYFFLAVSTCGK